MTSKKIAFITGANRGLGLETAKQLGQQGAYVVLGARDAEEGRAALDGLKKMGIEGDAIEFDLKNPAHHAKAAAYFSEKFGRLDVLINNAAVALEGQPMEVASNPAPVTGVTEDILRETMEVNFFSVFLLTQTLVPLLLKSEAGRIVNVSSFLGSLTLQSDPQFLGYPIKSFAYNTSKTALNSLTVHLAYELRDTPIKVNSANPGWVQTRMGGNEATMTAEDGAKTAVQLALLPADGPTGGFFHAADMLPW
jgi:NAD(P)-dependent dehydrogenase (short-subunit alcohol dehydrogenase family)